MRKLGLVVAFVSGIAIHCRAEAPHTIDSAVLVQHAPEEKARASDASRPASSNVPRAEYPRGSTPTAGSPSG